jgi:hypothetical protein
MTAQRKTEQEIEADIAAIIAQHGGENTQSLNAVYDYMWAQMTELQQVAVMHDATKRAQSMLIRNSRQEQDIRKFWAETLVDYRREVVRDILHGGSVSIGRYSIEKAVENHQADIREKAEIDVRHRQNDAAEEAARNLINNTGQGQQRSM